MKALLKSVVDMWYVVHIGQNTLHYHCISVTTSKTGYGHTVDLETCKTVTSGVTVIREFC